MAQLFTLTCNSLPDDLVVYHFRGVEALSQPYEYDVHFAVPEADALDLEDAIGQRATLTIDRGNGADILRTHGVLASIKHLHEEDGRAFVEARLVPLVWVVGQDEHSRVFTKKSLKDIIKEVLEGAGLTSSDYDLAIQADLPVEEHVTQYRESDLRFLERWLEREGLFYYFEQGDDAEKLIVTDANPDVSLASAPARYFPLAGHDGSAKACIDDFACERRALIAGVKLRDYDYEKPTLDLTSKATVSKNGQGERVRFGNRFFKAKDGDRITKVQAEGLKARESVVHASGTITGLVPGYTFELEQHPRGEFNKKYLVTELEHVGVLMGAHPSAARKILGRDRDEVYRATFRAIDHATPFRSPERSPWPRIYGTELAIVDGESESEYAQIDDQGRYLVRMMFDETDAEAGKASTWVRMAQPHGGTKEGFHFPLRRGTEVMMSFLGGDPDRPVIAAVVHNAQKPSVVTKTNYTQNRIFTGGGNEIEIEDLADKQYITLYTPKEHTTIHMGEPRDMNADGAPSIATKANLGLSTDGCSVLSVGGSWSIGVGGTKDETINGDVTESYNAMKMETVSGSVTEIYCTSRTETVTGPVSEDYASDHTHTVGGSQIDTIGGALTETVSGSHTYSVSGGFVGVVSGSVMWATGAKMETINGSGTYITSGAESRTVGAAVTWVHGGATTLTSAGAATIDSPASINLISPSINFMGADVNDLSTVRTDTFSTSTETGGMQASAIGLSMSAVGLSMSASGATVDLVGAALAAVGFKCELVLFEMDNGGVTVKFKGLNVFA